MKNNISTLNSITDIPNENEIVCLKKYNNILCFSSKTIQIGSIQLYFTGADVRSRDGSYCFLSAWFSILRKNYLNLIDSFFNGIWIGCVRVDFSDILQTYKSKSHNKGTFLNATELAAVCGGCHTYNSFSRYIIH